MAYDHVRVDDKHGGGDELTKTLDQIIGYNNNFSKTNRDKCARCGAEKEKKKNVFAFHIVLVFVYINGDIAYLSFLFVLFFSLCGKTKVLSPFEGRGRKIDVNGRLLSGRLIILNDISSRGKRTWRRARRRNATIGNTTTGHVSLVHISFTVW